MRLTGFSHRRPRFETEQARLLDWVAAAHAQAEAADKQLDAAGQAAFARRIRRVLGHVGCRPDRIRQRGHAMPDDLREPPHGEGAEARSRFFARVVAAYFASEYAGEEVAPAEILHVTCTGYVSPSGAQLLVADRGWGKTTRVTHVYHMGCYAAFPAVRLALATAAAARVDVVHTELCSLHFDPLVHSLEELVVQSLFGDGFIRYSVVPGEGPGLAVLVEHEQILPETRDAMEWLAGDRGMRMGLSAKVPELIAGSVRGFVLDLYARAGLDAARELGRTIFAVHPGGPKIIDEVQAVLELDDAQVATSRGVLADCGNMSSATVPHIWERLLGDRAVAPGTLIASLAFGPGLTIAGALLRKQ